MPEQVALIPFAVLAGAAVLGAVAMMVARNIVHAAFWLLEVMLAVAGLFMLLSAGFLALVQIMVYVGAVSVLMLFTVMLTLRRREDAERPLDLSAAAAGLAFAVGLAAATAIGSFSHAPVRMPAQAPGVEAFGTLLFSRWGLPLEIASVVLLVALVGAVWWTGGEDR